MPRAEGEEDQVETLDEEFLFHLNRGSQLLAGGDADGARGALERALELRPRDAKVLGLLGQACYRLGRYDDAIVAWQRLVDENPAEPAARVNLGLAFLRAQRQSQATRQLEIALDLNPDHKKAMGYLGLALLESGDPLRAREWFRKAGSDQMVARCDEVLARAAIDPGQATEPGPAAGAADGALPVDIDVDDTGPLPTPLPEMAAPDPLTSPAPASARGAWPRIPVVNVPEDATFGVAGGVLAVRVRSAVRLRLTGLVAVRGTVRAAPEVKHFRGRPTEKPFGEGTDRLHRVEGDGALLFAAEERRFTPLQVDGAAFVREESLFGLEDALAFENGRVPSPVAGALNLVHLRGQGAALVQSAGPLKAVEVQEGGPLRLPLVALAGWIGELTPRLTALLETGTAEEIAVELNGEGRVLVDPAAVEPGGTARAGERETA
ncbi:MAG TPA: tetratricopeptide repeat protein [Anaeromyxobacter sp.]|nr:tetratricopeptide repeat protein [Anaeromyxobacter sp.]